MSHCCANKTTRNSRLHCQNCGASCRKVETITLLHQIRFPDNLEICQGEYFFCANSACPIGYFSATATFLKSKLRSFKEMEGPKLCYCFDITEDQYRSALVSGAAEPIKNFVVNNTEAGLCACHIRNPSGQCCLAQFKPLEKEYRPA